MHNCPNCGRPTRRTEDWACQWCGYPLMLKSYRKIDKTYQQVKGEKANQPELLETEEHCFEPETESTQPEAPEQTMESEPVSIDEPTFEVVPEPESEPEAEQTPVIEPKPELAAAEPDTDSQGIIEVTVDQLLEAYATDEKAADERFGNNILNVTGVVYRTEVKNYLDFAYITLTNAKSDSLQHVRCLFDQKHGADLNQLTVGQEVKVQGTYDGSVVNIRLKDCFLVSS